jgi:hypothetical protein
VFAAIIAKFFCAPDRIVLVAENAAEFPVRICKKISRKYVTASQF